MEERKPKPPTVEQRVRNNALARARRASNPEKYRAKTRAWRASLTPEKRAQYRQKSLDYARNWYTENRETIRQKRQAPDVRARQREYNQKYDRARYKAHPERWREFSRKQQAVWEENPPSKIIISARHRAKAKGLEFNITVEDIKAVWPADNICPILGVPMERKTKTAPSIDRLDSSKGYVKGNIRIISKRANELKRDATPEETAALAAWHARQTMKPGQLLPGCMRIELVDEFPLPGIPAPAEEKGRPEAASGRFGAASRA